MTELAVIMPVMNEEGAIAIVLDKWITKLDKLYIDFEICLYDGGSTDKTLEILNAYPDKRVNIFQLPLLHGPSILRGYIANKSAEWLFQIDSDDEMSPVYFRRLWYNRYNYDIIIGRRTGRSSSILRRIVSLGSRMAVRIFYGSGIYDVNSPYRLIRNKAFRDIFNSMDLSTVTPNVIISGMACKKGLRILECPVSCGDRTTGTAINKIKLLKTVIKAIFQVIKYYFKEC